MNRTHNRFLTAHPPSHRWTVAFATFLVAVPAPAGAGTISAVSLAETVERSERILVVEVMEPIDSASPCELSYGFRYKVERALRGSTAAGSEDLYLDAYPRGDATSEECPVSRSFEAYFGDVRPPFERGQRLILFLGDRVPHHAFDSAARFAEVAALAGTTAASTPSQPPSPPATPPSVVPPATVPSLPATVSTPPATAVLPPPPPPPAPPVTPAGPVTGPTVLESEGRVMQPGVTELVFVSDDEGVAVIGGASSLAAGSTGEAAPAAARGGNVACRTPCRIRVPNGSYLFRVGTTEFTVAATGGEQTWQLEEENSAALAAGEHLTYDGIGTLAGAGVLLAITLGGEGSSDTSVQAIVAYVLMGLGFTSMAIGIPLWALCGGSAEQVSGGDQAGVAGLSLLPGPVAFDPWSGRTAWGLSLALTF